jgi:hypothetical protein
MEDGTKLTCDDVALLSTVKGWPHEEVDCAEERPRRERRVVLRRDDLRILRWLIGRNIERLSYCERRQSQVDN